MSWQKPLDFTSLGYVIFDHCLTDLMLLILYILIWREANCADSYKPLYSSEYFAKNFGENNLFYYTYEY